MLVCSRVLMNTITFIGTKIICISNSLNCEMSLISILAGVFKWISICSSSQAMWNTHLSFLQSVYVFSSALSLFFGSFFLVSGRILLLVYNLKYYNMIFLVLLEEKLGTPCMCLPKNETPTKIQCVCSTRWLCAKHYCV